MSLTQRSRTIRFYIKENHMLVGSPRRSLRSLEIFRDLYWKIPKGSPVSALFRVVSPTHWVPRSSIARRWSRRKWSFRKFHLAFLTLARVFFERIQLDHKLRIPHEKPHRLAKFPSSLINSWLRPCTLWNRVSVLEPLRRRWRTFDKNNFRLHFVYISFTFRSNLSLLSDS